MVPIPPIHLFPQFAIELPRQSYYAHPNKEMEVGGGLGYKQTKCLLKRWEHILCIYILDAAICTVRLTLIMFLVSHPREFNWVSDHFYVGNLHMFCSSLSITEPYL